MSFKVGDLIRMKEELASTMKPGNEEYALAVYLIIEYRNGYATRSYNSFIYREEYIEYDEKHKYYKVLYPDGTRIDYFNALIAEEQYEKISV